MNTNDNDDNHNMIIAKANDNFGYQAPGLARPLCYAYCYVP